MADLFVELVTDANVLLAAGVALVAGVVSFASPCVLPLVPGYLSYMTGLSGQEIAEGTGRARGRVVVGSLLFVLGFGIPIMVIGAFSATIVNFLATNDVVRVVMGVLVIAMGVLLARGRLLREYRVRDEAPTGGLLGAPALGFVFGVGWTPCTGPTLGAIFSLSAVSSGGGAARGAFLGLVYAIGIGLPFVLVGLLFTRAARTLDLLKRNARRIQVAGGGLLVLVGIAIATGLWDRFIFVLRPLIGGFETAV